MMYPNIVFNVPMSQVKKKLLPLYDCDIVPKILTQFCTCSRSLLQEAEESYGVL